MYNVAWGPSRIVNKTRRDLTQKLDKLDKIRELTRKSSGAAITETEIMSSPKPTFQPVGNRNRTNGRHHHHEPLSPQHQELIKFFADSWDRVVKELDRDSKDGTGMNLYFESSRCHPALENFKPFDLESYWGHKVYTNSTQPR